MELSAKGQRNTLILAVLALVVIGFSLIASTWQILRQQQESGLEYLAISARSISQTVENTFRRHWRMEGHKNEFWPRMGEFFSEIESGSEIIFIEIVDANGQLVFEARKSLNSGPPGPPGGRRPPMSMRPDQFATLSRTGEWYGVQPAPGPAHESVFVYGKRIRQIESSGRHGRSPLPDEASSFMVLGLSMVSNQGLYISFRQNALLQSAYILAAAVFIWAMAVSLISRRSIVGKAKVLQRFQAKLLDNLPDGLLTVGADNEIQAANPAAHEILGFREGGMVGKSLGDLPAAFVESLQLRPDGSDGGGRRRNVGWRQAEVGGKQLEILLSAFTGERDQPVRLLLFRDRTRLHSLERSLAEAEKMAAIGTLAAGVAHEIRNPLSALRGFAQYFAKKFSGVKPDEEYASTMVREADRLNRVITDLLYLARTKSAESVPVDLDRVVGEVGALLRFDLESRGIEHNVDLQAPFIMADPDSAKQALLNLALNSLDALEEKRALIAAASGSSNGAAAGNPEPGWRPALSVRSHTRDGWIVLELEDNGVGMNDEQRRQAFEAFFTSKAKGTGLGLSLVNKTVHEHGGRATIESEPGRWCRVSLFFPTPESGRPDSTEPTEPAESPKPEKEA